MGTYVLIVIITLILSAFFSGLEIAYISSNKIHLEIEKKQEGILAKILTKLTAKPSKFITTMLIGNTLALVMYGFFMGDLLVSWFQSMLPTSSSFLNYMLNDLSLLTQVVLSSLLILITSEFLPKVFFQIYSNLLLKVLAVPAYIFYVLFTFLSDFIIWISDVVLKYIFKGEGDQIQFAFTKVELGNYISEQMEFVEEHEDVDTEIQIFQNALEFSELKARDIMVPRTEIVALEINESINTLNALFTETGYTKILVYKDTIDDILGYVHSFELFKKPKTIKSVLLPVEFVPGTVFIHEVLNILIKKHKSIAVVLDEYGGTSGIMTVEDIVEELFGEIEDEHDSIDLIEEKIEAHLYKFSARLEVDYINETYKIDLPESENYDTIGGLIVDETEEIPLQGEIIVVNDVFQFTILEASNTKIDLVELKILEED
ncbi:hemolysin family protein [Confluentibacter citreus]|uniref:hemolysin family protein n=1 Tax=Confluentibacter citreus TaxID=2007307 RepID=UPI000C2937CF|nr:hemolysin family protein [Confluentibacter citreus]